VCRPSLYVVVRNASQRTAARLPLCDVEKASFPSRLAVLADFGDLHQRAGIPVGQQPQHHPVHHGVHRYRCTQSQRQSHHYRHREP
jgi:hypothetical protein